MPRLRLLPFQEEEYRVLMPFIKDGFEKGDRAFHVVDPKHRPDH